MKKIAIIIIAAAFLLLVGCGEARPEETSAATSSVSTIEAPTTTPATTAHPPPVQSMQGEKLNLPMHPNNGGLYVYHNGATYYRQYNAACYEKSGLWGYPAEILGAKKQMMRMDADGSVHKLFEDDGNGGIFMDSKGSFYLQRLTPGEYNPGHQVYSLDAKGNERWTVRDDVGEIYALDEARGVLICTGEHYYAVNCLNGKKTLLAQQVTWKWITPLCYDSAGGWLYFQESISENEYAIERVDHQGQNRQRITTIATNQLRGDIGEYWDGEFSMQYRLSSVVHAHKEANGLYLFVEDRQGTGSYYENGALVRVGSDGSWTEIPPEQRRPADYYGIFQPSCYAKDGPFFQDKYDYFLCASYGAEPVDVLFREELKSLGRFEYSEINNRFETEVIYAGRDVWFTVKDGDYDPEASVGWRDAYAIKRTYIYRKNGVTGEIRLVYEY